MDVIFLEWKSGAGAEFVTHINDINEGKGGGLSAQKLITFGKGMFLGVLNSWTRAQGYRGLI